MRLANGLTATQLLNLEGWHRQKAAEAQSALNTEKNYELRREFLHNLNHHLKMRFVCIERLEKNVADYTKALSRLEVKHAA